MIAVETKLTGDIERGLARLEKSVRENVLRSGASAMSVVAYDIAKAHVPVKTGLLRDSIYRAYAEDSSDANRQTYRVSWNKAKAPHGQLIEYGTSKMSAQPFMRPAFDRVGEAIKAGQARMAERLKEEL